jgi:hypothetical protein
LIEYSHPPQLHRDLPSLNQSAPLPLSNNADRPPHLVQGHRRLDHPACHPKIRILDPGRKESTCLAHNSPPMRNLVTLHTRCELSCTSRISSQLSCWTIFLPCMEMNFDRLRQHTPLTRAQRMWRYERGELESLRPGAALPAMGISSVPYLHSSGCVGMLINRAVLTLTLT